MGKFKRVLLKLSGESLMGTQQYGIDRERLTDYANEIKEAVGLGIEIGIVIGGGNIFRGLSGAANGFDRVKGDQMGMLATVINSLALSSALQATGVKTRVLTAIRMEPVGEFYAKEKAIESLEKGEVGHLICRNRKSLFHNRYRLIASGHRNRSGCDAKRYPRGMESIRPTLRKIQRPPNSIRLPMMRYIIGD